MLKGLYIDVLADKETIQTRTALGLVMAQQLPTSTLAQNNPDLQNACKALVKCGQELADLDVKLAATLALAAQLQSQRDSKVEEFDGQHAIASTLAEKTAAKPDEVQALGFTVAGREKHALLPPVEVTARYDLVKSLVVIQVTPAKGFRTCVLEISTDLNNPASWKRIQGTGLKRTLAGYAPGTYWIRAASVRAQEESIFTTPVAVVVK